MNGAIVIHINAFTRKISSGYRAYVNNGKVVRDGPNMTPREITRHLADWPELQVFFCNV